MKKYIPLSLVDSISARYPGCWQKLSDMQEENGDALPSWNSRCYIPLAGTMAIVSNGLSYEYIISEQKRIIPAMQLLAALAPWRIHKQVFQFPIEMEQLLYDQADNLPDMKMPMDVLLNLPYDSIYIEAPCLDENTNGFFVHFEDDVQAHRLELRFVIVYNDASYFGLMLHLVPDGTIAESLDDVINISIREGKSSGTLESQDALLFYDVKDEQLHLISRMLQLVLYICADNAEITVDPEQEKIYRKSTVIKDKYREVQKYECGQSIAESIRYVYSNKPLQTHCATTDREKRIWCTKKSPCKERPLASLLGWK